jgi:hypothetical protein
MNGSLEKDAMNSCQRGFLMLLGLCALVIGLWAFPSVWYRYSDQKQVSCWLSEQTNVNGWSYRETPVDASIESILVADHLTCGEFANDKWAIRVFSAKRYEEKPKEMGLFMHTPDRCWSQAGWKIEPVAPDFVEVVVHGVKLLFERRIFVCSSSRELVYFGGLVGGQQLPYRLDHNLGAAYKKAMRNTQGAASFNCQDRPTHLWQRLWESFINRRPLFGPQQFIRISTDLNVNDTDSADAMLKEGLNWWLRPVDYQNEVLGWKKSVAGQKTKVLSNKVE